MNNVQNTHIGPHLRQLHAALLDVISVMNRPQRDDVLLREAGIPLDRALFPLLIGIERFGPIGVVNLADRAGRDYTTVSRQVAKLEELGLVLRSPSAADKRVREAVTTDKGHAMAERVAEARERMGLEVFSTWEAGEVEELARLMSKFAAALTAPDEGPTSPAPGQSRHSP